MAWKSTTKIKRNRPTWHIYSDPCLYALATAPDWKEAIGKLPDIQAHIHVPFRRYAMIHLIPFKDNPEALHQFKQEVRIREATKREAARRRQSRIEVMLE